MSDLIRDLSHKLIGSAPALKDLRRQVLRVAPQDSHVLILGESGSGKELVAEAIHEGSPRASGPFVKVNCAALPPNLLEAELFGHEAGAFTGATQSRRGRFALADGGTIFLDEIAEIPRSVQTSLLRVLQDHEFTPIGSEQTLHSDFRLVCATNRDLGRAVADGTFQSDLYFRIHVVVLELPPLRDRSGDVPRLAEHFLKQLADRYSLPCPQLGADARERLQEHPWPGNVRELQNAVERVLVTGATDRDLNAADFAFLDEATQPATPSTLVHRLVHGDLTLELFEGAILRWVVDDEGGNLSRAAARLGLTPRQLRYRLDKISSTAGRREPR